MDGAQQVDYRFYWDGGNLTIYKNGKPEEPLIYSILCIFFSPPFPPRKPSFTIKDVTVLVAPGQEGKVESIVQQLEQDGFLMKNPSKPKYYQYNYNCPHVETQADFEKAVAYEYLPKLPRCEIIGGINIFL